jgi:hypothetical protein
MCEQIGIPVYDGAIIGTVGIIIGAIIAIVIYFKAKKKIELKWVDIPSPLLSKSLLKVDGLKLVYKDRAMSNIMLTRIILENSGNETIKCEDIATTEPLRIFVKNPCSVIELIDIEQTETANNFKVALKDENSVLIDFEYMDPKNVAIISILHTFCEKNNFSIHGRIKGGKVKYNKNDELKYCMKLNEM